MPTSSRTAHRLTVAISLLILGHELGQFLFIGTIALWVVMVFALVSAVDYFVKFAKAVLL